MSRNRHPYKTIWYILYFLGFCWNLYHMRHVSEKNNILRIWRINHKPYWNSSNVKEDLGLLSECYCGTINKYRHRQTACGCGYTRQAKKIEHSSESVKLLIRMHNTPVRQVLLSPFHRLGIVWGVIFSFSHSINFWKKKSRLNCCVFTERKTKNPLAGEHLAERERESTAFVISPLQFRVDL